MKLRSNTTILFIICSVLTFFVLTGQIYELCKNRNLFLFVGICILILDMYLTVRLFREVFFWKFMTKEDKERMEVIYVKINLQFVFIVVGSFISMLATPFVLRWLFNLNGYVFFGCMFISVISWLQFILRVFGNEFHDVVKEVTANHKRVKFIFLKGGDVVTFGSEGTCEVCGGDLYLRDDVILCCDTCYREYNCMTGEVIQEAEED